jgi:antitoxin (DNA-binding transcriptional repressor) of toxin-antitoxin stability system
MTLTVPSQQAAAQLVELVHDLAPGDEIVLTDGGQRLARIIAESPPRGGRRPGACKGMLEVLDDADDDRNHAMVPARATP